MFNMVFCRGLFLLIVGLEAVSGFGEAANVPYMAVSARDFAPSGPSSLLRRRQAPVHVVCLASLQIPAVGREEEEAAASTRGPRTHAPSL